MERRLLEDVSEFPDREVGPRLPPVDRHVHRGFVEAAPVRAAQRSHEGHAVPRVVQPDAAGNPGALAEEPEPEVSSCFEPALFSTTPAGRVVVAGPVRAAPAPGEPSIPAGHGAGAAVRSPIRTREVQIGLSAKPGGGRVTEMGGHRDDVHDPADDVRPMDPASPARG